MFPVVSNILSRSWSIRAIFIKISEIFWEIGTFLIFPSPIDFAQDDINRANDRDEIGNHTPFRKNLERFEIHEAARSFVPSVWAVGAVAYDVEAKFAFGTFDSGVRFAYRRSEAFGVELEVVDE
jgi:hypothetical protein